MRTLTRRPLSALLAAVFVLTLAAVGVQSSAHAAQERRDGFISGRVIDPATGDPVKGVTVKVLRINSRTVLGSDKTGPAGRYRINGLLSRDEELDILVNGSAVRHETGWVGCAYGVVRDRADGCSHSQGPQSPIRLQHL